MAVDQSERSTHVNLNQRQLDFLKKEANELEDKMGDWLNAEVKVLMYQVDEETLVDPTQEYDEYVALLVVDGREIVSFTEESAIDAIDLLSMWAVRHLIISCGSNNRQYELPEPAQA